MLSSLLTFCYSLVKCPKCENVKKEMQDFLRAGGKNFDIGFVNIDRNPLVAKDIGAAREFKSFKLALFEKRSHTPKV